MLEQAYEKSGLWRSLVIASLVEINIKTESWKAHSCILSPAKEMLQFDQFGTIWSTL